VVWTVLGYALLSDLATALGAVPFAFLREVNERWQGILTATSGGMMVAAGLFALNEGKQYGAMGTVLLGLLAGALFLAWLSHHLEDQSLDFEHMRGAEARQSWLLLLTLFAHSFPEGVAIGVGFATGELMVGLLLALAIAVHNIPEGLALALPLRAKGVSVLKCAWYAILSSLPQPLVAVPAYLLARQVKPFLPFGLGFAAGAMIFLTMLELVPDSLTRSSRSESAWGFMVGLVFMLLFFSLLH